MIRINDIKDDELRELAYKRTLEDRGIETLKYIKKRNVDLKECFKFEGAYEGHTFWWEVSEGNITKIS